jgi:hypothetical protein
LSQTLLAGFFFEAVMVTPDRMRQFAAECLRWSEKTDNARQRDLMIRIAKQWMTTAAAIERRLWRFCFDRYRPELHYMRGPGPRCREKRASDGQRAATDLRKHH